MLLLLTSAAFAGSWHLDHQLAISWFGMGARYLGDAEYRLHVPWEEKGSLLFDDVYVAPGPELEVSPAYVRAGARVHVVPIAVLDITADVLAVSYFGTFGGMNDFDTPEGDYSEEALATPAALERSHSGLGVRYSVTPTLQAKVSHLCLAFPQEFTHFSMVRPADAKGDYWYENQYDALLKWDDTLMVNSALAFWAFREDSKDDPRMFWLGARFDHQLVFGSGDEQLKAGPMAVFKPGRSKFMPTFVVFGELWLKSRAHPLYFPPYLAAAAIWS